MDKEKENHVEHNNEEDIDWDEFFREEHDEEWEKEKARRKKRKSLTIKIVGSLLAFSILISGLQIGFNFFNIPAIKFLEVSKRLSDLPEVSKYKESIVTIEWDGKKGTGFNIDTKGTIVTNDHVVDHTDKVKVSFKTGETFIGTVTSRNEELDLAIINIEADDLPILPLSFEKDWEKWLGEKIIFIGNPLAFTQIANEGTIIGESRVQDISVPVMVIDAPIYKGNSGSPVINPNGEVIGIIFATISGENKKRVGVATPSHYLQDLLEKTTKQE